MKVNFLDLKPQYISLKQEIDDAIANVINETAFIKSKPVSDFEVNFGKYLGAEHVVSCGNGTDALEISLAAFEIGKGDEVLVPAMSWISTSEVVATAGATPVFVDIDPRTYCIDISEIEKKITKRTKAIIPVHLYGHPADMLKIMQMAKKHDLKVIEDCAQAHGAEINGKKVGTFGDVATFSFFPTKNLGAFGDAGAIVAKDKLLRDKISAIANHGQEERHKHILHGRNSRMDGIQAAILNVKLKYLDNWLLERHSMAKQYTGLLQDVPEIDLPFTESSMTHGWHLFVIKLKSRDQLKTFLEGKSVQTMIHYPKALPFQPCYSSMNNQVKDFPIARRIQDRILSLPFYPGMPMNEIEYVCNCIKKFKA